MAGLLLSDGQAEITYPSGYYDVKGEICGALCCNVSFFVTRVKAGAGHAICFLDSGKVDNEVCNQISLGQ